MARYIVTDKYSKGLKLPRPSCPLAKLLMAVFREMFERKAQAIMKGKK